jgi:hypothetical protein
MKTLFLFLTTILLFSSCCEELVEIPEIGEVNSPRVVLLEELTGVSCPNCPVGTEKIKELKNTYGDNLVVVAIHGDFLSWPTDESKYDFRFEEAKQLENYLRPWQGKPAASMNRTQYLADELSISNPQLWGNYVKQELDGEHRVNLDLELEYNEDTRVVDITANILPVSDFTLDEEVKITVMILESEIEDAQEDPTTIIEEYTHNHVLRDFATEWSGQPLNKELFDNVEEIKTFSYTIPEPNEGETLWNPEHMEVVAFLHSNINGEKKVFQAAEAKITE